MTGPGADVVDVVRNSYELLYQSLSRGRLFESLWRRHAYLDDFPVEFAHMGLLTAGEARDLLGLLRPQPGDVLVDVGC